MSESYATLISIAVKGWTWVRILQCETCVQLSLVGLDCLVIIPVVKNFDVVMSHHIPSNSPIELS